MQEMALEIEFIHESVALAGNVVVLGVILHGECNEQLVTENLNVEGGKPRGQVMVGEAFHLIEVLVEHVDGAVAEVRRVQHRAVIGLGDCETLIDRAHPQRLAAIGRIGGLIDRDDGLSTPFQPEIVPSSVANRKVAGLPFCNVKAPVEAKELNT